MVPTELYVYLHSLTFNYIFIKKSYLLDITLLKHVILRLYRHPILHVICTIGLEFGAGDLDRQTKLS